MCFVRIFLRVQQFSGRAVVEAPFVLFQEEMEMNCRGMSL